MPDQISPLRRSQAIAPYSDAEQFLLDNAFASPFIRSLQQTINTDVAGAYRQQALEAQVRGDAAGQRAAEYNRRSALRRMDLRGHLKEVYDGVIVNRAAEGANQ